MEDPEVRGKRLGADLQTHNVYESKTAQGCPEYAYTHTWDVIEEGYPEAVRMTRAARDVCASLTAAATCSN